MMSKKQLLVVEADYKGFIPKGQVISCREARDWAASCDICGHSWIGKEIVVKNTGPGLWKTLRLKVCRNGVACREHRLNQIAGRVAP